MSLTVESYGEGAKNADVVDATRVLIRDAMGNPVCLAVSWNDGGRPVTLVAHHGDDDFENLLRTFGTENVTVLRRLHIEPKI